MCIPVCHTVGVVDKITKVAAFCPVVDSWQGVMHCTCILKELWGLQPSALSDVNVPGFDCMRGCRRAGTTFTQLPNNTQILEDMIKWQYRPLRLC